MSRTTEVGSVWRTDEGEAVVIIGSVLEEGVAWMHLTGEESLCAARHVDSIKVIDDTYLGNIRDLMPKIAKMLEEHYEENN